MEKKVWWWRREEKVPWDVKQTKEREIGVKDEIKGGRKSNQRK